ncbi:MAG: gliding motility-associated lipoprotein [Flavobacteriales bacterium]|nr:gliding motility-associated lipoprotein [Flavobacteriales bacterium]|tara:strand:+ start:4383 stop:5693 length:1311 start_codon:yes stop_codon:yes gene_type:complete
MKKILLLCSVVALMSGCVGSGNGELIGGADRLVWNPTDPYGMVFIPQGSFVMGPSDQDVPFANVSTNQRVSVGAFYMDETEITNNEYRQFERWVVDSMIRTEMKLFKNRRGDTLLSNNIVNGDTLKVIDWSVRLNENSDEYKFLYDSMFVKTYVDGQPIKEENNFIYRYEELDIRALSKSNKLNEETIDNMDATTYRDNFVIEREVKIYPSTLDYQSDYAYSNNETDATFNYEHVAHDDYPVVGITWEQANAFCHWRTHIMNSYLRSQNEPLLPDFRLPTETEWEYAARGGLGMSPYPWGGPYTRNMKGCFLANFKPLRGNYVADGGLKAIKVRQYNPNNYGLYDMAGNVAEWTSTVFDETSTSYSHDMNSDNSYISEQSDQDVLKRKVVRGGSWKDISYFIQTSTRTYEYDDVSTSYIGFRCVMDFLGRDKKDFQ